MLEGLRPGIHHSETQVGTGKTYFWDICLYLSRVLSVSLRSSAVALYLSDCPWRTFYYLSRVSCTAGWPQIQYVLGDDLRTPDLPASTPHQLGLQVYATMPGLYNAGDSTQGFVHGRQALFQLSCLSNRTLISCSSLKLLREPRDPTPGSDLHPESVTMISDKIRYSL